MKQTQYLKDEFKEWLQNQTKANGEPYSGVTVNQYINTLKNSTKKLKQLEIDKKDLFYYTNVELFTKIHSSILQQPDFKEVDLASGNGAYSAAMNLYKKFLEENIWDNSDNKAIEDLILDYVNHKNSPDYDEKYKWDFAIKHQGIFNDLSNLSEKISNLGAPNFQSYFMRNSGIKWMLQKYPEILLECFSVLFDNKKPLKERIVFFRKTIKNTLTNDIDWKNKELAEPGIDTASFFLFANDYLSNILFTKVKPYNNYAKIFKLDKMSKFTDYEQRYIDWQNYCLEILIPTMDKVLETSNTLLDAQDFIWFAGSVKSSAENLRKKFIEYFKKSDIIIDDSPKDYTAFKLDKNIAEVHRVGNRSNKFRIVINFEELDKIHQANVKRVPDSYNWTLNGEFWIDSEETCEEAIEKINNILKNHLFETNQKDKGDTVTKMTKNVIPLNQILYGPPGTGKTYSTKAIKDIILENNFAGNKSEINKSVVNDVVKDLYWYSAIALSMYLNGKDKNFRVKELENQDIISAFSATRSSKNVYLTISAQLQIHTSVDSKFVNYTNKTSPAIFEKTENAEWYLTEAGIKYVEEELEPQLLLLQGKQSVDKDKFCQFITFHQSYSYEEFIEGIRPNLDGESDTVSYELKNGIFKEMCIKADSDLDNSYVLVIDEINRGNISKIFGELITLIEDDKRVVANGEFNFENTRVKNNELLVTLPYSQKMFGVPENLYLVGTMNTSDRSIASVDIALRRRFKFKEMMPKSRLVPQKIEGLDADFREIFESINKKISILLDREHQIGHSYFINVKNIDDLKEVWFNNITPLLNEYFYGEWDKLKEIIPTFINETKINDLIKSPDLADEYYYDFYKESDFNAQMPFEEAIKLLQIKKQSGNNLTISNVQG